MRWGAIALGAATDIGASQLCGTLIMMSIGLPAQLRSGSPAELAAAQADIQRMMASPSVFFFTVAVGLTCSAAGGYLTAYLAKTHALLNATVMGLCSTVAGSLMLGAGRASVGLTELALAAATVPAAALGGLLAQRLCGRPHVGPPAPGGDGQNGSQ